MVAARGEVWMGRARSGVCGTLSTKCIVRLPPACFGCKGQIGFRIAQCLGGVLLMCRAGLFHAAVFGCLLLRVGGSPAGDEF